MEFWIRSQDKSKIVKVNEIYSSIQEDFGTSKFGIYSSNANYYQKERPLLLGNYKSKERALEVLDEIQDKMNKGSFAKVKNGLGETTSYVACPLIIYEMPID